MDGDARDHEPPLQWLTPAVAPAPTLADHIQHALEHPLGGATLGDVAGGARRVTIAFDPHDPECPNSTLIPLLLDELAAAGVEDPGITLLLAHNTRDLDLRQGWSSVPALPALRMGIDQSRYRLVQHDPFNVEAVNQLGVVNHIPLAVNYHAVEADVLIATGSHALDARRAQRAGAMHTVAIGCGGIDTIQALFEDELSADDHGRDTFDAAIRAAAQRAGLAFSVECHDAHGEAPAVRAGRPLQVAEAMTALSQSRAPHGAPARPGPAQMNPWRQAFEQARNAVKSKPARVIDDEA